MTSPDQAPGQPRDWRGVPITPGADIVYMAEVHSANGTKHFTCVEGRVRPGDLGAITAVGGRIVVQVIRRSKARDTAQRAEWVYIKPDRITVLSHPLPPSDLPTEEDMAERDRARIARRKATEATHRIKVARMGRVERRTCQDCTATGTQLALITCDRQAQKDMRAAEDTSGDEEIAAAALAELGIAAEQLNTIADLLKTME